MNYKVSFIPAAFESKAQYEQECETQEEAEVILNAIANYTLLLHEHNLMPDHSNCGMVLKRDNDDWIEIDSDGYKM